MNVVYALHREEEDYRYIGVTRNSSARLSAHRSSVNNGSMLPVHCWMRKYDNSIKMTVVDTCDTYEEALEEEIYLIAYYRMELGNLLNISDGGSAPMKDKKHKEDSKEKISKSLLGNIRTLGHTLSEEHKKKCSEALTGRKYSKESKVKMSESLKGNTRWAGKKHKEESKSKIGSSENGRRGRALGLHNRWHVARDIINEDCDLCKGEVS